MDPNENLEKQRSLRIELADLEREEITIYLEGEALDQRRRRHSAVSADLIELAADLDEWISEGGFLPEAWRHRTPLVAG
jgi:hypothetical protein